MQLGLVTYNLARAWDLETLISNCEATGFTAVELRTTHAHGVEPELDAAARRKVRDRFAASQVRLVGLGSICEFHSTDPAELRKQIDRCSEFAQLAADTGAVGVKVRPNGLPEGRPVTDTLAQIGDSLRECGETAAKLGVQIWLEVHGRETSRLEHIETILKRADHPNVLPCWNSNPTDLDESGSIASSFARVAKQIGSVHINELYRKEYPYRDLFHLLRVSGYDRWCLAELGAESSDPLAVMRYYRALFEALGG